MGLIKQSQGEHRHFVPHLQTGSSTEIKRPHNEIIIVSNTYKKVISNKTPFFAALFTEQV
jgi:hypothetical protein